MLVDLISRYLDAQKIWDAQFDEDNQKASNSPEWKEYMSLSSAIIDFRCSTMLEIRHKAQFILSEENLVDILANCSTDAAVCDFLKSMATTPVDNGRETAYGS